MTDPVSTHTAGEWISDDGPGGYFVIGAADTGGIIATLHGSDFPEAEEANAAFIVRACNSFDELLAACVALSNNAPIDSEWGTCGCCNRRAASGHHEQDCPVELARDAIARSTEAP